MTLDLAIFATPSHKMSTVHALLEAGADKDLQDSKGDTALT